MKTDNPFNIPFKAMGELAIALEEVVVLKLSKIPKLLPINNNDRPKKMAT
jgi:hypothetical protein